jgi:uncharacterized protein (TIGR03437 family)
MRSLRFAAIACAAAALQCVASAQPAVSAVLNGASYSAAVAPGCWVAIFGANLAESPQNASGALGRTHAGVSVSVAGLVGPLLYVSPGQINALIPPEVAIPANTVVPLVLTAPAGQSKPYVVRLSREAPGISLEMARRRDGHSCLMPASKMPTRSARTMW